MGGFRLRDRAKAGIWRALALVVLFALALVPPARAEEAKALRGVALVIGQSAYAHLPPLANPEGDAAAIEDLFGRLGFETTDARNTDARKLRRTLQRFAEDAEGADVAIVYYAGHGIEGGGENFLVPVDADLAALDDAGERLVPLTAFLAELRATVPLSIVMLDACRDNPFPPGALLRREPGAEPAAIGGPRRASRR
ncbi:MAG: caspase family protein, partial [Rhizobiaceae bacterium]